MLNFLLILFFLSDKSFAAITDSAEALTPSQIEALIRIKTDLEAKLKSTQDQLSSTQTQLKTAISQAQSDQDAKAKADAASTKVQTDLDKSKKELESLIRESNEKANKIRSLETQIQEISSQLSDTKTKLDKSTQDNSDLQKKVSTASATTQTEEPVISEAVKKIVKIKSNLDSQDFLSMTKKLQEAADKIKKMIDDLSNEKESIAKTSELKEKELKQQLKTIDSIIINIKKQDKLEIINKLSIQITTITKILNQFAVILAKNSQTTKQLSVSQRQKNDFMVQVNMLQEKVEKNSQDANFDAKIAEIQDRLNILAELVTSILTSSKDALQTQVIELTTQLAQKDDDLEKLVQHMKHVSNLINKNNFVEVLKYLQGSE